MDSPILDCPQMETNDCLTFDRKMKEFVDKISVMDFQCGVCQFGQDVEFHRTVAELNVLYASLQGKVDDFHAYNALLRFYNDNLYGPEMRIARARSERGESSASPHVPEMTLYHMAFHFMYHTMDNDVEMVKDIGYTSRMQNFLRFRCMAKQGRGDDGMDEPMTESIDSEKMKMWLSLSKHKLDMVKTLNAMRTVSGRR
jgi:hypothetical protein